MDPDGWLFAFLLTQAIESPIFVFAARKLGALSCWTYALGASTITHPLLWFCLPWQHLPPGWGPYLLLLAVGETLVITIEALWGRYWKVPHFVRVALIANLASIILGATLRLLFLAP